MAHITDQQTTGTYRLFSNAEDVSQSGDGDYTPGWIVPPCGMDPEFRGEDANGQPMESVAWPVTENPEEAIRLMDRALTEAGWRRVSDWRVDGAEWEADIEKLPELWTVTEVAEHFGVSVSRARAILSEHRIERVAGYPAADVLAIQRPGQGARTDLKEPTMPETPDLNRPYWSVSDIAAYLNVNLRAVYTYIENGEMPVPDREVPRWYKLTDGPDMIPDPEAGVTKTWRPQTITEWATAREQRH